MVYIKKHDFLIFGNCATVQMLKFHEMPVVGKTSTAFNPFADEIFYGGCAFNVFYAMAKLGADIYPALTYADPRFERKIYDICNEFSLETEGIEGPKNKFYSTCLMLQDDNKNHITMMYHFGEDSDKPDITTRYIHEVKPEYFDNCRMAIMVMSSPSVGYSIIEQVKLRGTPLAFSYRDDPLLLPKDLLDKIFPECTIIFCNEIEAIQIADMYQLSSITDWFALGRAQIIVVTLGKRGSVVYERGEGKITETFVPITQSVQDAVDSVGAGDAFVAGFLYGYMAGRGSEVSAQYGSTLASFVVEEDGSTTNLPTLEMLIERNRCRPDHKE